MRAHLYIRYIGKLHKSAVLDVPDGTMVLDVMPDARVAQFQLFGSAIKMPPLKFYRITGCEQVFDGAVFWTDIKDPLHETGSSV